MRDKTVIVIAHRLSTIMKMDRIIVVDGGTILESGTHAELLAHHLQIPLADAEAILVDKPPGVMLWDELTKIQRSHMRLIPKDRRPK